jgi:hypothetical protein
MRQQPHLVRLLSSVALVAVIAAGLGGCQTMSDVTGSLGMRSQPQAPATPERAAEVYGDR